MKTLTFVVATAALIFSTGCDVDFSGTPGSGVVATQDRSVDEFHAISVSGIGDVEVQVGGEQSVSVSIDDNLLEMVKTDVENGVLKIYTSGSIRTSKGLDVKVSVASLDSVTASGIGNVKAVDVSGPSMKVDISGVGSVTIDGEVDQLDVSVSGTGSANLKDLIAKDVKAEASGTGKVTVHASQSVDANASGVAGITVYGNPEDVKKESSGVGNVEIKGSDAE
ncbi:head GIN domain-containing protein [Mariniblastus fucicola]|uniref:Putative auto-transporter adhesin head GIN domain-containing protein n=1 Tax=Mariniblastus fucicola TaxID=980251 RepID=A0A5B9P4B7_9BACT|nr:head GIN domain-containing protein [Mariniblastus fucicola]QEG21467.1 hypothetical protein MFFC18_13230 [Mariniblastus fucicola]